MRQMLLLATVALLSWGIFSLRECSVGDEASLQLYQTALPSLASGFGPLAPVSQLNLRAAPDQRISSPFALKPGADLHNLTATVELSEPSGLRSDLRVVRFWSQQGEDGQAHTVPELLMRDDRVNLSGDWSYDRLPSVPDRELRTDLSAGDTKYFLLTLRVPPAAAAGTYQGQVSLQWDGGSYRIPISLEVLPIELPPVDKITCIYFRGVPDADEAPDSVSLERLSAYLRDIREHGFSGITIYRSWSERFPEELRMVKEAGFTRVVLMQNGSRQAIERAQREATAAGLETYFYGIDEPFTTERQDRQESLSHLIHAAGGKVATAISVEAQERLKGAVDWPNFTIYREWRGIDSYTERLRSEGKTAAAQTYYWQCWWEDPVRNRLLCGFALANSHLAGVFPYVYQHIVGNPYDDFDAHLFTGFPHPMKDMMMTYPTREGFIPTLQWEAIPEGWSDLRYLLAFQQLADRLRKDRPELSDRVRRSERRVKESLTQYPTFRRDDRFVWQRVTESGLNATRELIISEILNLKSL